MDPSDIVQLVVLLILIGLSAVFSSAETSMVTCNRIRIRNLEEKGDRRAIRLNKILESQAKMLSAILIGNNVVNLSASSLATIFATRLFGSGAVGLITGIMTLLVLVFGEIAPKTLATIHADRLALAYSGPIASLMWILTPVIFLINAISGLLLRLLGVKKDAKAASITESELRTIVEVSHEEGVIEKEERNMIRNVVDFGDSRAKDIMVPRIDMTMIQVDATYEELMEVFREDMFTRFPVYEADVANVIGLINMKDVLLYDKESLFTIRQYLRKAHYTYENKRTSELLKEMREANASVAIVLDEYGDTVGLVTIEDLLEEIVGEIRDEYDGDEGGEFTQVSDGEYLVDGAVKLSELNEWAETELASEDYDTVGGYVMGLLDHLPVEGEEAVSGQCHFRVEKMDRNRVEVIRLKVTAENA